ncbi:MAG: FHA domain-containing protein [Thermoanaerobaculia bacterium]|nr:FHA domain-containing protein [Thermoanaerobaculia bacterium]
MIMTKCPACVTQNEADARYCQECGAPLLMPGVLTIGRDPDNRIVLDYPMISRHHARIQLRHGAMVLEDLGSANGTAVGRPENRIRQQVIQPDDVVFLAPSGFRHRVCSNGATSRATTCAAPCGSIVRPW